MKYLALCLMLAVDSQRNNHLLEEIKPKKKLNTPRLVHGIGINDADYVVQVKETIGYVDGKRKRKLVWICPYYQAWKHMLERCYSAKFQKKRPTYSGCSVLEE